MSELKNPVFTQITQVCPVVEDIWESVKIYNDVYGIGPWRIYEFDDEHIINKEVHGKPEKFNFLAALCNSCGIEIELVQPLTESGTFAEFLREHGPGLHHLLVTRGNSYGDTMALLNKRGIEVMSSATFESSGMTFLYPDTTKDLGFIMEFVDTDEYRPRKTGEKRKPMLQLKGVYPPAEEP